MNFNLYTNISGYCSKSHTLHKSVLCIPIMPTRCASISILWGMAWERTSVTIYSLQASKITKTILACPGETACKSTALLKPYNCLTYTSGPLV